MISFLLLLLLYSHPTPAWSSQSAETDWEAIVSMVGPLSSGQQDWLEQQAETRKALASIAQMAGSDRQQATAIYCHFTEAADPLLSVYLMMQEMAVLQWQHPDWSLARVAFVAAWRVSRGATHTVLDLVGLIPALGEGADFVNGVLYWLEGDKHNAVYSFAATVPGAGWTAIGAKYAGLIVITAKGAKADLKFVKNSGGFLTFGRRSQLVSVIGKKANHQAHHIIPWASNNHEVVQQAARSGKWHPNLAKNGVNLDLSVHNGYDDAHRIYSTRVQAELEKILNNAGGTITPQDAANVLRGLADKIRSQLKQGKKLDEITF